MSRQITQYIQAFPNGVLNKIFTCSTFGILFSNNQLNQREIIMKIIYSALILFFCTSLASAQDLKLHLSVGGQGMAEGELYPTLGAGIEARASRRWTVFGDFDYGLSDNTTLDGNLVDRTMLSIQPGVRWYFREAYRGLNVSVFGSYFRENTDPAGIISIPNEDRTNDDLGVGFGLGYGAKLPNGLTLGFNSGIVRSGEDDSSIHFRLQLGYLF